jgi:hypothetical protein
MGIPLGSVPYDLLVAMEREEQDQAPADDDDWKHSLQTYYNFVYGKNNFRRKVVYSEPRKRLGEQPIANVINKHRAELERLLSTMKGA